MARIALVAATLSLLITTPALARNTGQWSDAGGVVRDALVIAALGVPAVKGDWHGDLQAAGSLAIAELSTDGLKLAFPEWRPDRSDRRSFPSGHAALSFAAAATLQNRYGWKGGVLAQLAAGFVGLSRIEARKHHWYDMVAGAALGEASGFLITSKQHPGVVIVPWGDGHGGGATLATHF